ncbi:MAG: glycoside hydrolase family 3 protein [Suipraeoptans sp.]
MTNLSDMYKDILEHPDIHPYPENMQLARACAADGMVLLKNDKQALPLTAKKVAVFGAGAADTVTCGTGSGYATAPYTVSVMEGLIAAGVELTTLTWLERFIAATKKANEEDTTLTPIKRMWSGLRILIDDLEITESELKEARTADTAIYVIRRNAGENGDRKAEKGDYYLSDIERRNLETLGANFDKTIVVLNTCVVDACFIEEIPGLEALLYMGLAGNESGNALADILTGKVCPSGRLTDTWARKYSDYPAAGTFGENAGNPLQQDYQEDIFVGYRYFDSFGVEPFYPFGYGLSYTSFKTEVMSVAADWQRVVIRVRVTNTGKCPGREVVQVYVTAPEGRLVKPYQELKGFGKTAVLKPEAATELQISIPTESLASYNTDAAAFIMEAGDYLIRVGGDSRNTKVCQIIRLDMTAVVRTVNNEVCPDHELQLLVPPVRVKEVSRAEVTCLAAADCPVVDDSIKLTEDAQPLTPPNALGCTLPDVKAGNVTLEEFTASLEPEVLYRLVAGASNETHYETPVRMKQKAEPVKAPSSSGSTTALFTSSLGIPNCNMTDGPAGLHMLGCATTSYPAGILIAQTWDQDYAQALGSGMGKEMEHYKNSVLLGPGMNIHRDPLCGRNFEYYSEDPLLTGKMAAAATKGVQSVPGIFVAIKHFACNNQEAERTLTNSTVSERALREIYLRGFEICVREANPKTVMSSYNKLNGVHTSSNYELLTEILRGEWGFSGLVMTDWGSKSDKSQDLHAGNDLIMGGYRSQFLKAAFEGSKPEFAADGFVKEEEFEVYGGFMKEQVQYWNAFVPSADGKDEIKVMVAADTAVNPRVLELEQDGIASIAENADGSRMITYRGTDRGAYLSLGDLQRSALRVLDMVMNSSAYDNMLKQNGL